MSRKWLERESPSWVEKEIITSSQAERLLGLYEQRKQAFAILPILGSILVGLGILSFVAANWQGIPHPYRLAILIVTMIGFYATGERFIRTGDDKLGLSLVVVGLASFGASIFLIGQMFHIVAYGAGSFIIWGTAALLLTYVYRSRLLFVLTAIILNISQMYSLFSFNSFNPLALAILVVGLGLYWWFNRDAWLAWLLGLSVMMQSAMLVGEQDWNIAWFLIPVLLLYALGDWIRDRGTAYPLQGSALTAAYIFGAAMVMASQHIDVLHFAKGNNVQSIVFIIITVFLLAVSMVGKWRNGRQVTSYEWLLLIPWFLWTAAAGLLYLLALCLFSLCVLWHGYTEEWRFKINMGTVLFLFAVLLAYTRLAWEFMDKSLFFLIGGTLLLVLSWYLNRRRRKFLESEGEESHA